MSGDPKKILVVEDNLETQLIIKVTLRDNYNIELTNNSNKAISLLKDKLFDLVLLDVNLNGEGNGKDILTFLRENYDRKQLPVIVMTAYDLEENDKNFFDENANEFISKPIDKNLICSKIEKLLNHS
jgi:CheY-like chemotaxis protein